VRRRAGGGASSGASAGRRVLIPDAESAGNRVRKNLRHLRKWSRREGVTCFRVYDRDIPEVPITVDWYEGRAVLHDVRKHYDDRDEAVAAQWLDEVAAL